MKDYQKIISQAQVEKGKLARDLIDLKRKFNAGLAACLSREISEKFQPYKDEGLPTPTRDEIMKMFDEIRKNGDDGEIFLKVLQDRITLMTNQTKEITKNIEDASKEMVFDVALQVKKNIEESSEVLRENEELAKLEKDNLPMFLLLAYQASVSKSLMQGQAMASSMVGSMGGGGNTPQELLKSVVEQRLKNGDYLDPVLLMMMGGNKLDLPTMLMLSQHIK